MRIRRPAAIAMLFAVGATVASADSWLLPVKRTYCSTNERFCVEVVPRDLRSALAYFQDKVADKEPAGLPPNAKEPYCRASVFEKKDLDDRKNLWAGRLRNDVAPVQAMISNDGKHVVTFDNWHSAGYGTDVVVFYGPKGEQLRQYSLEELLGDDANKVPRSVSSRWWRDSARLDEDSATLTVVAKIIRRTPPTLESLSGERDGVDLRELKFDLHTGELISNEPLTPPAAAN